MRTDQCGMNRSSTRPGGSRVNPNTGAIVHARAELEGNTVSSGVHQWLKTNGVPAERALGANLRCR